MSFEFDPSITPTLGNTWDLINARQVVSAFDTVNLSRAPPLPLGQIYNVRTQPGGLGQLVQLAVEQRLVLNVNQHRMMYRFQIQEGRPESPSTVTRFARRRSPRSIQRTSCRLAERGRLRIRRQVASIS